jgi:hypothetical protein
VEGFDPASRAPDTRLPLVPGPRTPGHATGPTRTAAPVGPPEAAPPEAAPRDAAPRDAAPRDAAPRDGEPPGTDHGEPVDLGRWPVLDLPGMDPAHLLTLVTALDPRTAGADRNLGAVAGCEQVIRYLSALQVRHIAACAAHSDPVSDVKDAPTGAELTVAELAPMLGLSRGQATNRVTTAQGLVHDLPKLLTLVQAGTSTCTAPASSTTRCVRSWNPVPGSGTPCRTRSVSPPPPTPSPPAPSYGPRPAARSTSSTRALPNAATRRP